MASGLESSGNASEQGGSKAEQGGSDGVEESFRKLCGHYSRGCSFVSPCCGKVYPCRLCHNDKEIGHEIDRYAVTEIVCRRCSTKQPVAESCNSCGLKFGRYFCPVCRLYDDDAKGQFHCDKCGLCRVGGREKYFHCDTCGFCLSGMMRDSHKCRKEASKNNCPVCFEDIHTSRDPSHVPSCGHLLHTSCYKEMLDQGLYRCPLCYASLADMSASWRHLDVEREAWQMPQHLQNFIVKIQCRDCREESETAFHIVGLKCPKCSSYNTVRSGNEELPEDNDANLMAVGLLNRLLFRGLQRDQQNDNDEGGGGGGEEGGGEGEGEEGGSGEDAASGSDAGESRSLSGSGSVQESEEDDRNRGELEEYLSSSSSEEEESESESYDGDESDSGSFHSAGNIELEYNLPFLITHWNWGEHDPGSDEDDWHEHSDWSDSNQSDASWETENEEVIIGGEIESNEHENQTQNQDSSAAGQRLEATGQLQDAGAYNAHIRLDLNGVDLSENSQDWETANKENTAQGNA